MTGPPLIAVAAPRLAPGRVSAWSDAAEAVQLEYLDGLRRAGAVPVALGEGTRVVLGEATQGAVGEGTAGAVREGTEGDAVSLLARFDGLVLVGGPDLDPATYGAAPHPETYGIRPYRDRFEAALCRAALAAGVPIFAICRGIQVLNVALGGTLVQHLPDLDRSVLHGVPVGTLVPAVHPVEVASGSRLARLVGATRVEACVSIHHQAVGDLAPGLVATAWSADGVVEAVETPPDGPWCVGVQWHPERSAAEDPVQQALFDGFVARTAG